MLTSVEQKYRDIEARTHLIRATVIFKSPINDEWEDHTAYFTNAYEAQNYCRQFTDLCDKAKILRVCFIDDIDMRYVQNEKND